MDAASRLAEEAGEEFVVNGIGSASKIAANSREIMLNRTSKDENSVNNIVNNSINNNGVDKNDDKSNDNDDDGSWRRDSTLADWRVCPGDEVIVTVALEASDKWPTPRFDLQLARALQPRATQLIPN